MNNYDININNFVVGNLLISIWQWKFKKWKLFCGVSEDKEQDWVGVIVVKIENDIDGDWD